MESGDASQSRAQRPCHRRRHPRLRRRYAVPQNNVLKTKVKTVKHFRKETVVYKKCFLSSRYCFEEAAAESVLGSGAEFSATAPRRCSVRNVMHGFPVLVTSVSNTD